MDTYTDSIFCNQYYDASLIYTLVKHVPVNGDVKKRFNTFLHAG